VINDGYQLGSCADLRSGIRVFWAKVVSSERGSLLTANTRHTFWELQYALRGPIVMELGDHDPFVVAESDFTVIPPDLFHQVVEDRTGARFIMAFSVPLDARIPTYPRTAPSDPAARALLDAITNSAGLSCKVTDPLYEAFAAHVLELYGATGEKRRPGDSVTERIFGIIERSGGVDLTVEKLASQTGLSVRHLGRITAAKAKKSPRELIHYQKLKRIEDLAASTELSLREIALLCGFCDEYAMNRFFRRHTSLNLSAFRKNKARR